VEAPAPPVNLTVDPACVAPRESFHVSGSDLGPGSTVVLRWLLPGGGTLPVEQFTADGEGRFSAEVQARPIAATKDGVPSILQAEVAVPLARVHLSQAMLDVFDAIMVTIFMALLSTTLGTIIAAPLSFLAASNITRTSRLGSSVTTWCARCSTSRAFSRWSLPHLRPHRRLRHAFRRRAGACDHHRRLAGQDVLGSRGEHRPRTDRGHHRLRRPAHPGRALRRGSANHPRFPLLHHLSLGYQRAHLDIGFVDGSIGYYLSQRISSFEYHKASTALVAVIIVVWALDFLSAQVRKRMA
jgi:hypothetical protein